MVTPFGGFGDGCVTFHLTCQLDKSPVATALGWKGGSVSQATYSSGMRSTHVLRHGIVFFFRAVG